MKVTIIPIVIVAFRTVTEGLLKGMEGRPSKLLHYWDRPGYREKSWRLEETWCHSNSSEWLSASTDEKYSPGENNNDNYNFDLAKELKKTMELESDVYHIYQPLRSGRIWHKVNFLSGV